jgi:hypothetical protein
LERGQDRQRELRWIALAPFVLNEGELATANVLATEAGRSARRSSIVNGRSVGRSRADMA